MFDSLKSVHMDEASVAKCVVAALPHAKLGVVHFSDVDDYTQRLQLLHSNAQSSIDECEGKLSQPSASEDPNQESKTLDASGELDPSKLLTSGGDVSESKVDEAVEAGVDAPTDAPTEASGQQQSSESKDEEQKGGGEADDAVKDPAAGEGVDVDELVEPQRPFEGVFEELSEFDLGMLEGEAKSEYLNKRTAYLRYLVQMALFTQARVGRVWSEEEGLKVDMDALSQAFTSLKSEFDPPKTEEEGESKVADVSGEEGKSVDDADDGVTGPTFDIDVASDDDEDLVLEST